jgi:sugar O-acyltransferase (sialic acid O-acetyltransferase NeuD family)
VSRSVVHLLGAGGHATVIADIARRLGFQVAVWYHEPPDEHRFPAGTRFGHVDGLSADVPVLLAVGDIDERRHWRERHSLSAPALIDYSATVAHGVSVGEGVVVMARVVINPNSLIDVDAILNTACVVEHDCHVGRNSHIAPGVLLGGGARVGNDVLVGTGAVVLPWIEVGSGAVIGAGAVVTESVPEGGRFAGVPARPIG